MSNFKVPASKASFEQNQFKFDLEIMGRNGKMTTKTFSLPMQQYVSSSLRARVQRSSIAVKNAIDAAEDGIPSLEVQLEAADIQQELFERYVPGLYELVTDDQIRAIQEAWQEASQISLGESSPSAD